jgi:hypothetical protein
MIEPQNTLVPLAEPAPADIPKGDAGFGEMLAQTLGMVQHLDPNAIQPTVEEATEHNEETPDLTVGQDGAQARRRRHIPTPPMVLTPGDGLLPAPRPVAGPVVASTPDPASTDVEIAQPALPSDNATLSGNATVPGTDVGATPAPAPPASSAPVVAPDGDAHVLPGENPIVPTDGTTPPAAGPTASEQVPIIRPDVAVDTKRAGDATARRRQVPPGRGAAPTIPLEKEPVASVPAPPQPSSDRIVPSSIEAVPVAQVAEQAVQTSVVAKADPMVAGGETASGPVAGSAVPRPDIAVDGARTAPTPEPVVKLADAEVRMARPTTVSVPESRVAVEPATAPTTGGLPVSFGDPVPNADSVVTQVGTPAAPTQHTALAERVLQAVELQANQPPPRTMVVDIPEIEGLRLVVSVRAGAEVHVVPATASTAGDGVQQFFDELQGVLESRGFVMTGDGRRRGSNPQQDETQEAPTTPRSAFRRPAPSDGDLRI